MAKTFLSAKMRLEDLAKLEVGCAWEGCSNSHPQGANEGWVNLVTWKGKPDAKRTVGDIVFSANCLRDAALCPKHAKELESLLKTLGSDLDVTVGSA